MSFLTYAIAAKLERGTHLLDTLVSKQDIPKDQLERDLNTLQFNPSTLLKAELIERDFHKAVDVLFTKRLVARGNASYGVEIEGEERVIESLKLVHQVTNNDIYQSGLQSLAYHLGSRKLIETTNAVVLGGDIELTDAEYEFEKPYTDETIATILKSAETDEKTASENMSDETANEQETVDDHEFEHEMIDEHEMVDEHESEHETVDEPEAEPETVDEADRETVDESEHEIVDESEHETVNESEIEHETSDKHDVESEIEHDVEHEKVDASEQTVVDSVESSEVVTDTVTPSETATEAATKELPFSDAELEELAKGIIERGNKLAVEVPDFGHSETSDVLAVLGDSTDEVEPVDINASEDAHASEQATSAVSEAEALNHMIDEISTDLKTSEKSEADVTASEGPSVEDVAKAFGGSLDGVSVVSNLGRLHEVGKPITSQFAR
jgi:polyphosphate kinase